LAKSFFTSESVTEGHPDKMCDQIADSVLDNILEKDEAARVACEVAITQGLVHIMGEITTSCYVDISAITRNVIHSIGYNDPCSGFDSRSCAIITSINSQSPDIAVGVNTSQEAKRGSKDPCDAIGAGDQGIMFGFACDETPEFMPMPIVYANNLARRLAEIRKNGILPYLLPDGKTQVTVEYENGVPLRVDAIVISAQHREGIDPNIIRHDIIKHNIEAVIPSKYLDNHTKIHINPTGRFVIGGPMADTGLTGRKLIVDTYGGYARHGGGAFSGKDLTKLDRSGAYAARWVAKSIVASGFAKKCEVQLAYAIGIARPVSILIETFNTSTISESQILKIVKKFFDLRPFMIIKQLSLGKPLYHKFSAYGHMGRTDLNPPWENFINLKI
jgi:S-adenosylmethionine synthetase